MKNNEKLSFWVVGKNYCIRTVTMIQVGTLVGIDEHEVLYCLMPLLVVICCLQSHFCQLIRLIALFYSYRW